MRSHLVVIVFLLALPVARAESPTPPPPQPTPPPEGAATFENEARFEDDPMFEAPVPSENVLRGGPSFFDDEAFESEKTISDPDPDPDFIRAADAFPPEEENTWRDGLVRLGAPVIAPTFAVAASARSVKNHDELASASIDFWVGGRVHPMVGSAGLFFALGAEMNFRENPRIDPLTRHQERSYAEVVPEVRFGFASMREPHGEFANAVFPDVELYAITGWRIANRVDGHALRLGLGVSAPIVIRESGAAWDRAVPSMLELTMDVDSAVSGDRELAVRFGWHF